MSEDWDLEDNEESIIRKCPFCGGKAEPDPTCTEELEHCLQCKTCGACIYMSHNDVDNYKEEVTRAWNRRT